MADTGHSPVGWRDMARAVPGGIGIQEGASLVYISPAFASVAGTEVEALTGEDWQTLIAPAERQRFEGDALTIARTDGRWAGTVRFDQEGTERSVDVTLSALPGNEDIVLWVVSEGGGGKRQEVTGSNAPLRTQTVPPRASSMLVGTVLDSVDDVVYVIGEDGKSWYWNDKLVETTGYSHEEIQSMHPGELIPPDQQEYVPGLLEAIEDIEDRQVEVDILTKDGERITHEFSGTTFEDPATGRSYRCGIARDITERLEHERELERYETIVEAVDDGVYVLDEDLRFTFVNEGLCELFELSREELLGTPVTELFDDDDEREMAESIRQRVVENDTDTGVIRATIGTAEGERRLESRYRLHPEPNGQYRGSVGIVRDVTSRMERERALERQRDELATLNRINDLLFETARELIQTGSRDAVEEAVCDRLASSELYDAVWIGERELDGEGLVSRASAGVDTNPGASPLGDGGDSTDDNPVSKALQTGRVEVASSGGPSADWEAATDSDIASLAAVPLQHGETVYGVLVVTTTREGAFGIRERAGFEVLGRLVGVVIHAARSRELLFADTVVELEFDFGGVQSPFVEAASTLDCRLTLDGYVPSQDGWVVYLTVDDIDPSSVVAAFSEDERVERARCISGEDDTGRIEVVVAELSVVHVISDVGASVKRASATPEGARLVIEAPVDVDVRRLVDKVTNAFPAAELLATRKRDREITAGGRPGGVLEDLTERQREVLEAAYQAGYFSWPRESTAEEVAESLGLTSPTLHGHLRKAETAILSALLDDL